MIEPKRTRLTRFQPKPNPEKQLMLAAGTDSSYQTIAHTWIGEMQLLAGSTTEAKVHFNWVKTNGDRYYFEYNLAIAEFNR